MDGFDISAETAGFVTMLDSAFVDKVCLRSFDGEAMLILSSEKRTRENSAALAPSTPVSSLLSMNIEEELESGGVG